MRLKIAAGIAVWIFLVTVSYADTPAINNKEDARSVLSGIEKRYSAIGFSARFQQFSTLKAMEIVDTASGSIVVKRPGMMKWAYESPEKQVIVSDGRRLWVYRPEDNQVMVGSAPAFFGNGKGAGFLSDLTDLEKRFEISRQPDTPAGDYSLALKPREKTQDISQIRLVVSKETFDITRIITVNGYGDETRIQLSDIRFPEKIDDSTFVFTIPAGADVIKIDE